MSSSFPAARFPTFPLSREKETELLSKQAVTPALEEISDEVLIARICEGDQEGLGLLFRRYCRLVWSIGQRVLRNKEEADDLLQDVFLFVRRKAGAFDSSKGTVRSFLVHITYQRAISHRRYLVCRHFYSQREPNEKVIGPDGPGYDESLDAFFGRAGVEKAFAELSEQQRETLRLHFFDGFSLEEVAAKTGQSYGNVRHYYYRALEKLRKHLKCNV